MDISYQERKQLDALSKEIFGVPSKWKKFLDKPQMGLATYECTETVIGVDGAPDKTEVKTVPLLTNDGHKIFEAKYFTLETLKVWMLNLKKQRDEYIAKTEKEAKEKAEKEQQEKLAKSVQENLSGTAI
jgi:hypothetical protein